MQVRLLIFGVLVHALLLLWFYDVYRKNEITEISCPPLNNNDEVRRLVLLVIKNVNQRDSIKGLGSHVFSKIPVVAYFGDSLLLHFYNISKSSIKYGYPIPWVDNSWEDPEIFFSALKDNVKKINGTQILILLVLHVELDVRRMWYMKHELDQVRTILNQHHGDNKTTCLLLNEEKRTLWSSGIDVVNMETTLPRRTDVVPIISTLLNVNMPYSAIALLPSIHLNSDRHKAVGFYCNALNVFAIAEVARQNAGALGRFTRVSSGTVSKLNTSIAQLLIERNYTGAIYLSRKLLSLSVTSYMNYRQIVNMFTFLFVLVALVGWITILIMEYLEITSKNHIARTSYLIQIVFILLSLTLVSVPFIQNWPNTYHFYFQIPILILWLASFKCRAFFNIKFEKENVYKFLLSVTIILLAEEYVLFETAFLLPLSICLVALLPCLPKFRKVPFIFIIGWCIASSFLLGATFLVNYLEPTTEYINLSGTLWLIIAGIIIMWMRPRRDAIFTCLLTVCLGAAMWLRNVCLSTDKSCHLVLFSGWPLFAITVVPIFGKSSSINKILQCIIALGVPIMFTSSTLEPLVLLLILSYTAGWASLENYHSFSNWDNLRRMSMLIFLYIASSKLIATYIISFKCLLCEFNINSQMYIIILQHARQLVVYSSISTTYRLILGSHKHGYISAILASLVSSIASLRLLIPFSNLYLNSDQLMDEQHFLYVKVNTMAIILIISYNAAMIFARNNKQITSSSSQSFELNPL